MMEKTRRFLVYLAGKTPNPGVAVGIRFLHIEALLQTYYAGVVDFIVDYLKQEGLVAYCHSTSDHRELIHGG